MQRRKNNRKSNGKKTARKTNRRDIFAEDFFREEDGDFDEEDMDNVTDDTLEFLSLVESCHGELRYRGTEVKGVQSGVARGDK